MTQKSRNGVSQNILDQQTQLRFNSDLLVLDKVEEDESPEESDRALGLVHQEKSNEIRMIDPISPKKKINYQRDEMVVGDIKLPQEVMFPNLNNKQKSAPILDDDFKTPLRQKKPTFEPYKISSSDEEESSIEIKKETQKITSTEPNIEEPKKIEREYYGIEYIIQQEKAKEGEGKLFSKKLQSEIDSLKYPSEIIEFHIKDKILKYIANDRLDDFVSEMKKLQNSEKILHKESESDLSREKQHDTSNQESSKSMENSNSNCSKEASEGQSSSKKEKVSYKIKLFTSFWLALHLEKLDFLIEISALDPVINKLCMNLIKKYNFSVDVKDEASVSDSDNDRNILRRKLSKFRTKNRSTGLNLDQLHFDELENPRVKKLNNTLYEGSNSSFKKIKIRSPKWEDKVEVYDIKTVLKTCIGSASFTTNILKHFINTEEERLACILVSRYLVGIDDQIILKALNCEMLELLRVLFTYSKNFHCKTLKFYSFEYLIDNIKESKHNVLPKVESICKWKIKASENLLKCLLESCWDHLAIKYCEFYIKDADRDLLRFCIKNENEDFLKHALNNNIFLSSVLDHDDTVTMILDLLYSRTRCDYIINIMMYSDYYLWSKDNLYRLYIIFSRIKDEDIDKNILLSFYNPILALAIICDILNKIGNISNQYTRPAKELSKDLQNIGNKLSENLNEELIKRVYMATNFKGQTLLRIIVNLDLEPFVQSQKVEELIETLWTGKETYECDGTDSYFSKLTYISTSSLRFLPGKDFTLKELVDQDFEYQYNDEKFWYQYYFRRYSIKYIFAKECLSVVLQTFVVQLVNYKYTRSFRKEVYAEMDFKDQYNYIEKDLESYLFYNNYLGFFFSVLAFYSFLMKIVFHFGSDLHLPIDKWTVCDILSIFINIICYAILAGLDYHSIIDTKTKEYYDWISILIVLGTWLRLTMYLLVIHAFSVVLNTLFKMVAAATSFMYILISGLLLFGMAFVALYISIDSASFGTYPLATRTLFDAMLGNYVQNTYDQRDLPYKILFIVFMICCHVFLLNFLIAILSLVYAEMSARGKFAFLSNKYQYIEKLSIPLKDQHGYKELIIHPCPLNVLSLPLMFFIFKKEKMPKLSLIYSYCIYWVENIIMLLMFLIKEVCLIPSIYIKTFLGLTQADKLHTWLKYSFIWLFIGPFVLMYHAMIDTCMFVKILWINHKDNKIQETDTKSEETQKDNMVVFTEVIDTMKAICSFVIKSKVKEQSGKKELRRRPGNINLNNLLQSNSSRDNMSNLDEFGIVDPDSEFIIRKDLLINAWKKYRPLDIHPGLLQQRPHDPTKILGNNLVTKILDCINIYSTQKKNQDREQNQDQQDNEMVDMDEPGAIMSPELNQNISNSASQLFRLNNFNKYKKKKEKEEKEDFGVIPENEIIFVESLLDRFIIPQDTSNQDQINIKLALKCLPLRAQKSTFDRIDLINFKSCQLALIAFQNDDQDEIFDYYSSKNKRALFALKKTSIQVQNEIKKIKEISDEIEARINYISRRSY
ncbi:unnamed protein product [Moneuplotes crassus]|uniref:Ion transport domain-containing protein n=1 Tax=Euplotes crassus TaxID=5936 RepID=A0AAD1U8A0_EUPCR|nr:unnamed protein product [Moneuplotes crassus]